MWLFHDPCAGTNIWNAYDEDSDEDLVFFVYKILRELARILWGYKQSHDSVEDESYLGGDSDVDES